MTSPFVLGVRAAACILIVLASSCSNEPTNPVSSTLPGEFSITFDNVYDAHDLELSGHTYVSGAGEDFTITGLRYYVTNLELVAADGSVYTVPAPSNYYLIDEANPNQNSFEFGDIPANSYTAIRFIIGVDSARSVADMSQRTGVLDTSVDAREMFISPEDGYVFFKLEGLYSGSPFSFNIAGYGNATSIAPNNLRTVTVTMPPTRIDATHSPAAHIVADIANVFNNPTAVSIATHRNVGMDEYSRVIATNYATMFVVDHVHGSHEE